MDAAVQRRTASEHSLERLKLARRLAQAWVAQPGCIAVAVVGSAAEGCSDKASDLDMCVFWSQAPGFEALDSVRAGNGNPERFLLIGEPAEGGCVESYPVDGIRTDFAHSTLELWQQQTDEVLVQLNLDSPWQKGMAGTLGCVPLYGADHITALQARLRPYPDALRLAMLQRYCRFMPLLALKGQALERGDLLWASQLIAGYCENILYTLCALNSVYHAMEFKRLEGFISRELAIAPDRLAARLDSAVSAGPLRGAEYIEPLVLETLSLVEQHFPDYDTLPVRRRFERPV
ncbi:hypothetical protein IT575_09720 [bacterium]|nr:hypothetical protein [bacterium]